MTKIYFLVTDMDGNPIQNAKISGQANCHPYGGGLLTATTGRDGKAIIDTGCILGGHGTFSISALGYEDQIINVNFPICYPFTNCDIHKVVTLAKTVTPTEDNTVITQSGTRIQASKTESLTQKIKDFFQKEPLIAIGIIIIIGVAILMLLKPQLAKSMLKTAKTATKKGAKATKGIIKKLSGKNE